jgi:DNA helicase-2/ATP-dependent DNA helicase PcrA
MTYRMAHMLSLGINPSSIVAVTFTNKAAGEMRTRVAKLVDRGKAKFLNISTFHSFCLKIFRQYVQKTPWRKGFLILDMGDQLDMMRRTMEDLRITGQYQPMDLLLQVSQAKNRLLDPAEVVAEGDKLTCADPELLATVYQTYQKHLVFNNVIDFDDCILQVAHMLQRDPQLQAELQEKYQYFMVDEFQDTNYAQLELVRLFASQHRNICVVGDDDQSIYSWRGAMYQTIALFESYFPELRVVRLEQNYRCSTPILQAANQLIRNNPIRKGKTLWSDSKVTEPIRLTACLDELSEANQIASRILGLTGRGYQPKDIAILIRQATQGKAIELALRDLRLPYKIYGGQSFFDKKEVKDFLAYVRLTLNPKDHLAFYRTINTPSRGIGVRTLEKIHQFSQESQIPPLLAALDPALQVATGQTSRIIHEFNQEIHALHVLQVNTPADFETLGQQILRKFKLGLDVEQSVKSPDARAQRLETIRNLPAWLAAAAQAHLDQHGDLDAWEFLQALVLDQSQGFDKKNKNQSFEEREHIAVMTTHAAKGLEFPVVFVCGMEDDIWPHKNSQGQEDQIHEERRLMYVAITRAKERLYLSHCHYRNIRKQKVGKIPSRFIRELPHNDDLIVESLGQNHLEPGVKSKEERAASTISRLSDLRASLK